METAVQTTATPTEMGKVDLCMPDIADVQVHMQSYVRVIRSELNLQKNGRYAKASLTDLRADPFNFLAEPVLRYR